MDNRGLKAVSNANCGTPSNTACLWCGVFITDLRKGQKYCSAKCRMAAWKQDHVRVFTSPDGKMKTTVVIK